VRRSDGAALEKARILTAGQARASTPKAGAIARRSQPGLIDHSSAIEHKRSFAALEFGARRYRYTSAHANAASTSEYAD